MIKTSIISIALMFALTSCKTQEGEKLDVEKAAAACAAKVEKRKERKVSSFQINLTTHPVNGQSLDIPLPYAEVSSDGDRPGYAWRTCMSERGFDTQRLDLGEKNLPAHRLPDVNKG